MFPINPGTQNWQRASDNAIADGHKPGSGDYWNAVRSYLTKFNEQKPQEETNWFDRLTFAIGDAVVYKARQLEYKDGQIINPEHGELYDPKVDLWDPEQYEREQKKKDGVQHIIMQTEIHNGEVHYGTNHGAWFKFSDFTFLHAATKATLAKAYALDAEDEEDEFAKKAKVEIDEDGDF